jgi:hypothetical protein
MKTLNKEDIRVRGDFYSVHVEAQIYCLNCTNKNKPPYYLDFYRNEYVDRIIKIKANLYSIRNINLRL